MKKINGQAERILLRKLWPILDGPVVKKLARNTGNVGSITSLETKISHAAEQHLGTTFESPCATTRSLHDATKTRHGQMNKQTNKIIGIKRNLGKEQNTLEKNLRQYFKTVFQALFQYSHF